MRSSTAGSPSGSAAMMRTWPWLKRLIDRNGDTPQRDVGHRLRRARKIAGDHDHVVVAGVCEAGGVAQAAIGVPMHQRADLAAFAQMQQGVDDRMVQQVLADRQVCADGMPSRSSRAAGPMPERCRMAGEWMAPAQRITSRVARGV